MRLLLLLLSKVRRFLFFLVGTAFLSVVLTACAGGGGGSGSKSNLAMGCSGDGVCLTFAPIEGGFVISNQSDFSAFGDFVSLNITATNGTDVVEAEINITEFSDGSYNFTGLHDQSYWTFKISGIFQNRSQQQQEVEIDFIWQDNRQDHARGGIRPGFNTDGDGRADSVDDDDDNDGLLDTDVREQQNNTGGMSCSLLVDCDGDSVRDGDEARAACVIDRDCDSDGIGDEGDGCPAGETDWTSNSSSDNDGDGCRDIDEDPDDDNDSLNDNDPREQQNNTGGVSCSLLADCDNDTIKDIDEEALNCVIEVDCDGDTIRDGDEAAGCVLDRDCDDDEVEDGDEAAGCVLNADCDSDSIGDGGDGCPVGATDWTSDSFNDNDGDGCRDIDEDPDDDNDGLDDTDEREQLSVGGVSCSLLVDCDDDGVNDNLDLCSSSPTGWTSDLATDNDRDGCRDADEDIDDDGDGLIEIETAEELDAVRYALNGNGSRLSADEELDASGCGGASGITACSGYELVANISLAAYSEGKGWQPLGNDIDGDTGGCQGAAFEGTFEGNGWTISDLSINRSTEDCVGLFGHIAANSEIRNLTLSAETVIGNNTVGALVGYGQSANITSSLVLVAEVSGTGNVGGLVGNGEQARIHYSSVVAGRVSGSTDVSGLMGHGLRAQIDSSSVVVGEVSGDNIVSGLVGDGQNAKIYSSSVVVGRVNAPLSRGGLVGWGPLAQIHSSSVVVAELIGGNNQFLPSGGLVGAFGSGGQVAYSYVVSGSNTNMLRGAGASVAVASYWDNETSGVGSGNIGEPKTSDELRRPTDYTGIYEDWDNETAIFGGGDVPLAVWCDRDNSGSIEAGEKTEGNLIWDFGTSSQYPAIRCTPLAPADWRSWWSLDENHKPQLNQTLLEEALNQ